MPRARSRLARASTSATLCNTDLTESDQVMRMRSVLLAVAALTVTPAISVLTASTASATVCSPRTSHYLAGTLRGQDGRDINAQISFDLVDTHGNHVDLNGCRVGGYART